MKTVIATIIISVMLLGLTMVGIQLWRNNMELINVAAGKVEDLEKIKVTSMLSLDQNLVKGGDVVSVIRYYSRDPEVMVEVTVGGITKQYIDESYVPDEFSISYEESFSSVIIYEETKIKKIAYLQKE
ncbi:hypothetical protein [Alkaliphilus crotonatoxidans]